MRLAGPLHQRGAVLLLSLLLLALLSALVTHALQANQWQRRIASHEIASARAAAAARSALRWGEQWLMSLPGDAPPECVGACKPTPATLASLPGAVAGLDPVEALQERWWLDHAFADGFDPVTGRQVASRGRSGTPVGRWTVIPVASPSGTGAASAEPDIRYYRILARAVPARRGQPVLIETLLARPWGDARWQDPLPVTGTGYCALPGVPRPCGRLRWQQRP